MEIARNLALPQPKPFLLVATFLFGSVPLVTWRMVSILKIGRINECPSLSLSLVSSCFIIQLEKRGGEFVQCPFGTNLTPSFQDQQILKKRRIVLFHISNKKKHTHKKEKSSPASNTMFSKQRTREYEGIRLFFTRRSSYNPLSSFFYHCFLSSSSSREGNPSSPSQACSCPQLRHFPYFGHSEHLLDEHT